MDKEKPFAVKDQEIINKYNKKRNQEITEEHLNNIEKLREVFKKEVINEYKEKLIKYLINNRANAYNGKQFLLSSNRDPNIKGIDELIKRIKNGDFD
ncbi:hypothetical protein [Spiroplasma endosymbiont of Dasysyrphus albostriatus]|uniref:hypothetical protein n=1 Tax=Spiroplasma endosymbiont of Dasysyrphus albostriatus TaxID=3066299 RepID=UPI0030D33D8A